MSPSLFIDALEAACKKIKSVRIWPKNLAAMILGAAGWLKKFWNLLISV